MIVATTRLDGLWYQQRFKLSLESPLLCIKIGFFFNLAVHKLLFKRLSNIKDVIVFFYFLVDEVMFVGYRLLPM